jgi:Flp pilus assembly protein TadD
MEPDWPPALCGLGRVFAGERRLDEAARAFEDCLAAAPRFPAAALELARVRLAQGDEDVARRHLQRAVSDPSSERDALRELVRLEYRSSDHAAVERLLPDALMADPATAADPTVRKALGLDARTRPDPPK